MRPSPWLHRLLCLAVVLFAGCGHSAAPTVDQSSTSDSLVSDGASDLSASFDNHGPLDSEPGETTRDAATLDTSDASDQPTDAVADQQVADLHSDAGLVDDTTPPDATLDATASCPAPRDESNPTPAIAPYLTRQVTASVTLYYYFPVSKAQLAGLVFIFHGSGGGGQQMFERIEPRRLVGELLAANYAVAALDSTDRDNKQWSGIITEVTPNETNPDVENVKAQLQFFKNQDWIDESTRRFYLGISNGGGFASLISHYVPVKATLILAAGGREWIYDSANPPATAWILNPNDSVVAPSKITGNVDKMKANPNAVWQLWTNVARPVKPNSFERIPGVSAANSTFVYDKLKAANLLDGCDMQLTNPLTGSESDGVLNLVPQEFQKAVRDQLVELYGEHSFTSEFSAEVLQFFAAQP